MVEEPATKARDKIIPALESFFIFIIFTILSSLLSLYFLFVYFHCTQIFKMALPIEDSSLSALWNNKKIEIRISDRISSPFL